MADYRPYASSAEVFVSQHLAGESTVLLARLRAHLEESERLLCVLSVAKIRPPIDVLVVTSSRVLAGWRGGLEDDGFRWPVDLAADQVAGVEVTGFMDNVRLLDDGDGTKVGNLRDGSDEQHLRAALEAARSGKARRGPDDPPVWEVYPG